MIGYYLSLPEGAIKFELLQAGDEAARPFYHIANTKQTYQLSRASKMFSFLQIKIILYKLSMKVLFL